MLIHTHRVEEDGEKFGVHVLHVNQDEATLLVEALSRALTDSPEAPSYAITLGRVEMEVPVEDTPNSGIVIAGNGLIAP